MKLVSLSLSKEELELITRLVLRDALVYGKDCPKVVSDLTDLLYDAHCRLEEYGLQVCECNERDILKRAFQCLIYK